MINLYKYRSNWSNNSVASALLFYHVDFFNELGFDGYAIGLLFGVKQKKNRQ
jgi:hypothetical protein